MTNRVRPKNIIAATLLCLPPLAALYTLLNTYVDYFFWDEWNVLVRFTAYIRDGDFYAWHILWEQHFSHRPVLLKLLSALNFAVFSGNQLPLLVLAWAFQLCLFFSVLLWLEHRVVDNKPRRLTFAVPISAVLFCPAMTIAWVWPICLAQVMTVLFFILAVLQVERVNNSRGTFTVVLFAVLCTLSTGNGIVVWPVLIGLGALLKTGWRKLLVILLFGILTTAVYFHGLELTEVGNSSPTYLDQLLYVTAFLGSPFSLGKLTVAIGLGGAVAIVYCWLWLDAVKRKSRSSYTLLAWGLISLFSALAGAMYRMNMGGAEQALVDRYVPLILPIWLSCIAGILFRQRHSPQLRFHWEAGLAIVVAVGSFAPATSSRTLDPEAFVGSRHAYVRLAREAIDEDVFVTSRENPWINLYPSHHHLLAFIQFLRQENLTPFRHRPVRKRLGMALKDAGEVCNSCPPGGTMSRVIDPLNQVESCEFGLQPGFAVVGESLIKASRIEDIIITDSSARVVGVGFPVPQFCCGWDWTEWIDTSPRPWLGFVSSKSVNRQTQNPKLIAFTRLRDTRKLIPLKSHVIPPQMSACETD